MRVIAGRARGRTLLGPPSSSPTRPTSDKVRQALFDILGPRVQDARVLDACAGTGALGLEALSRGARSAVFLEASAPMARVLAQNIERVGVSAQSAVLQRDLRRCAALLAPHGPFDLVLLDPPWDSGLDTEALELLLGASLLAADALCVVEHRAAHPPPLGPLAQRALTLEDERTWGDTAARFYLHAPPSESTP